MTPQELKLLKQSRRSALMRGAVPMTIDGKAVLVTGVETNPLGVEYTDRIERSTIAPELQTSAGAVRSGPVVDHVLQAVTVAVSEANQKTGRNIVAVRTSGSQYPKSLGLGHKGSPRHDRHNHGKGRAVDTDFYEGGLKISPHSKGNRSWFKSLGYAAGRTGVIKSIGTYRNNSWHFDSNLKKGRPDFWNGFKGNRGPESNYEYREAFRQGKQQAKTEYGAEAYDRFSRAKYGNIPESPMAGLGAALSGTEPVPVPTSRLSGLANQAGLADTILGAVGTPMEHEFPFPIAAPRGLLVPPVSPETTRSISPQLANVPVPTTRPDAAPVEFHRPGAARIAAQSGEQVPTPTARPIQVAPLGDTPVPMPAPRASQGFSPSLEQRSSGPTPPTQSQHENGNTHDNAYFASGVPQQAAAQDNPNASGRVSPDMRGYASDPLGVEQQGGVLVPTARPDRDSLGFNIVPAGQLGNLDRSTAARVGRGLALIAAGGHGAAPGVPGSGLLTSALISRAEKSDPGYFPAAPKTSGGLLGNMFGLVPVAGKTGSISDIIKSGPGNASYAGSGVSGIEGVISSTGPGAGPNASIGTVAASRSNPGFSVVGLGPVGYGRQSSKYGWTETVTPFGTSFAPHTSFETTIDPATGRRSVSRVDSRTGKKSVIAATRGPSRGLSFGRGSSKGLASFVSSLFGPAMTAQVAAPAVSPAAVSFASGPTAGPLGFSPGGLGGAGFGVGGLDGSFGPAGPGFGGGAHSNSTDSRGR